MEVEVHAKGSCKMTWKWKRLFSPDTPGLTLNTMPATLKLSATLEDSLALYIWQSFKNGREPEDAGVWVSSLGLLAQKANWDKLHLVSPQELIKLATINARANIKQDYAYMSRTKEKHLDWPVATRPLLLLVRTYLLSTSAKQDLAPGACGTQNTNAVGGVLSKPPDRLSTIFSAAPPSCHLRKLRAAFLLIKLLSVLSIFKPADNHVQKAVTTLLSVLFRLAFEIEEAIEEQADEKSIWDSEVLEAQELSLHIVRLAIPVMKQLVGTKDDGWVCCCVLLQRLMSGNKPAVCHAVASELIRGGGIPVLIAAVGPVSQAAVSDSLAVAVDAIHSLTSRADLPSELVDEAEDLLLRLQAVPRLITFLKSLTVNFAPLGLGDHCRWSEMCEVANLTNRLLMRQPEPSHHSTPPPTPTPAAWTAIQAVAVQIADISAFVECHFETSVTGMAKYEFTMPVNFVDPQYDYLRLRHELVKLPYNLLAVHLRNLELDVSELMWARFHKDVFANWDPVLKPDPHLERLGQAFVQRLAKDSHILKLLPEDVGVSGQKKSKCPGCVRCNGNTWQFKTETVAHLYAMLCSQARERVGHIAAGVTVQALYLALSEDTEQCRHLLTGTHTLKWHETTGPLLQPGLHAALINLWREEAALSTQLLTAACLARLCAQELQQKSSTPWFTMAVKEGIWDLAYDCICSATQVEAARPWSSLQCSALAAAMTTMADLQAGLMDQAFFFKQAAPVFEFTEQLLRQLDQIVRDDGGRYQLLSACVDFLAPFACFACRSKPIYYVPEELYICLTDALVEYTYDTLWLGKAQGICKAKQLSPDRLGWSGLDFYSLQPRILACYGPPCKTIEPWKHFWAKAMQDLPLHLALRVELALNAGDLSRQNDNRPDMKPYLTMLDKYFGLWPGSSPLADGVNFPPEAPPTVVTTLMRALYHYTLLLKVTQERLQKAKEAFRSAMAAGSKASALPGKDFATAKNVLTADREWFDELLVRLESMRTSKIWAPVIASLSETHWYEANHPFGRVHPKLLKRLLADALTCKGQDPSSCVLSPAVVRRLQACFGMSAASKGMQAQAGVSRTEDSARTAYEELMEEEDQAAAKAAAKKAKKLKQKVKKQQATVQTDETVLHLDSENEQEYDQFSLPHSATDAATETSANSKAASQAIGDMPSALSAFGALRIGNDAQSSAVARAVCSTDEASGDEAYNLPLINSRGIDQSDAAEVTQQVASVQDGDSSSHCSSGSRQGGVAAGAHNADGDAQFLQALFCCPITKALMVEPVIAADGYTYEKDALEEWLKHNSTSAVTGSLLLHTRIVPNFLIKSAISANTRSCVDKLWLDEGIIGPWTGEYEAGRTASSHKGLHTGYFGQPRALTDAQLMC